MEIRQDFHASARNVHFITEYRSPVALGLNQVISAMCHEDYNSVAENRLVGEVYMSDDDDVMASGHMTTYTASTVAMPTPRQQHLFSTQSGSANQQSQKNKATSGDCKMK